MINSGLQKTTQKTEDWAARIPLKTRRNYVDDNLCLSFYIVWQFQVLCDDQPVWLYKIFECYQILSKIIKNSKKQRIFFSLFNYLLCHS